MTVTVTMSKEEFIEYNNFDLYKSSVKCSIIDLTNSYNKIFKRLLDDGLAVEYEDLLNDLGNKIRKIEKEVNKK